MTDTLDLEHIASELADGLTWPGDEDTYRLNATQVLTVTVVSDDVPPFDHINGADVWGRVAWSVKDRYTGRQRRPDGFDGSARIVYRDGSDAIWWMPCFDVWGTPKELRQEAADETAREVARLLEDGFVGVIVTLSETVQDSRNGDHLVTVDQASLWGIDSLANGYAAYVVEELLAEVLPD